MKKAANTSEKSGKPTKTHGATLQETVISIINSYVIMYKI